MSGINMKVNMPRLIYGIGINDADYVVEKITRTPTGRVRVTCPYYTRWRNMIRRCYHKKSMWATYQNTRVCEDWLTFSNFKAWMTEQEWQGKQLDKDILGDGDVYSADTCCFISEEINVFVLESGASRGGNPIGVHFNKREEIYEAYCSTNGKKKHIGRYKTASSAHLAWALHKRNLLELLIIDDTKVEERLKMKYDAYVNNALVGVEVNG